jgi:hypothetical protein
MCKVLKQFTEVKGRNLGLILVCNPPPPPLTVKLRQKSGKVAVKILIFSGKICVIKYYLCEMITIFVKYTVNLHPVCLRICFRKRQNCSPRASKMEQFSGGGPPNPRFLPKLSMTVQVNHKKLYYNYCTLGKYLLKIRISGN